MSSGCRRGPRTKDGQILWQHDQSWDTRNLAWEPDQSLQTGDAWEHTRGIGFSFGYNQIEDRTTTLSGPALVRHFVDVVARGGNLLINVGLTALGEIPPLSAPPSTRWARGTRLTVTPCSAPVPAVLP